MRKGKAQALLGILVVIAALSTFGSSWFQWKESQCFLELNDLQLERSNDIVSKHSADIKLVAVLTANEVWRLTNEDRLSSPNIWSALIGDIETLQKSIPLLTDKIRAKNESCHKFSLVINLINSFTFLILLCSIYLGCKVFTKSRS